MRSTTSRMAAVLAPVFVITSVVGLASPANAGQGHGETGPPDTSVANWDAVGTQAFTAAALSPAEGHTIFAYVAIAVYDAVMAVEGGYEPFLVDADAPDGASAEAAVAAAARGVLNHYLPDQSAAIVEPAYAAALAAIPDGTAESDGVAIGAEVASELIALRANDGFRARVTYTPPDPPVPGVWLPTAPTPAVGTYLGDMVPFSLDSADQFRPDGPPSLRSRAWAREYNEVREIGSSTSTTRTVEQTIAAKFWGEPPVQQARGSFRNFVLEQELDVVGAARFMAMISVIYADVARAWPRLKDWLADDVEGQGIMRHLITTAAAWDAMGRPDSEIYRGERLTAAQRWRDAVDPALAAVERAFLDASATHEAKRFAVAQPLLHKELA